MYACFSLHRWQKSTKIRDEMLQKIKNVMIGYKTGKNGRIIEYGWASTKNMAFNG